ncbi:MAG: ribose 5-phosphate isomerase B [Actinobacteria bacterium]|nr:ribose 5-phosphate isomerase B [Actinomycetota bacterium]
MTVAIACDHTAIELKQAIISVIEEAGLEYRDFGTNDPDRADYPVFGRLAAEAVASGECDRGIILCGSGIGISITANKVKGIRCVVCSEPYSAVMSRKHNNTNMLSMGARVVGVDLAKMIAKLWLETEYEGGRHQRRVNQIAATEAGIPIENQVDPGAC